MLNSDDTMTNVEQPSSTSQLNSMKGNGHLQQGGIGQAPYGNGDSKLGNVQATVEPSTFGVILSPSSYANDGSLCRRPERVKIIVKRKIVSDDLVRERTATSNKKQKASSPYQLVGGEQRLQQLNDQRILQFDEERLQQLNAEFLISREEERSLQTEFQDEGELLGQGRESSSFSDPRLSRHLHGLAIENDEEATNVSSQAFGSGMSAGMDGDIAAPALCDPDMQGPVVPGLNIPQSPPSSFSPTPLSEWESKVPDLHNSIELTQWRDGPEDIEGTQNVTVDLELTSPLRRIASGGLEHPHTPKARRTPLFFPPVETAAEDSVLSSPSHSGNPLPASSPSPAKRSPLPLLSLNSSWPVTTPLGIREEDAQDDSLDRELYEGEMEPGFANAQFREKLTVGDHRRDVIMNYGDNVAAETEEQEFNDSDEGAEPLIEPESENEASDDLDADVDMDDDDLGKADDDSEAGHAVSNEEAFNEEELENDDDDDDFTALLPKGMSAFGQDCDRPIPTEELDALDDADLSYDEYEGILGAPIDGLHRDALISMAACKSHDAVTPVEDVLTLEDDTHTPSQKLHDTFQHYVSSVIPSSIMPSPTVVNPKFSFQSHVNGDLRDNHEDVESISQEKEIDSDPLEEMTGQDTIETSTSGISNDMLEEEERISSARFTRYGGKVDHHGKSKSLKKRRRSEEGGETDYLEDTSLSLEETPSSSEALRNPEKSVSSERLDTSESPRKATTRQSKLRLRDSTQLLISSQQTVSPSLSRTRVKRLKVKMSADALAKKEAGFLSGKTLPNLEAPITAKALLATGILAGYHVRYLDRHGGVMLTGKINSTGIICDCRECRGKQTVNVSAFEKHAGSSARHPSDFIYLDNGKNLKDVMEAGWTATENGTNVSEALQKAMQLGPQKPNPKNCAKCETGETELSCSREQCSKLYHLECAGLSSQPEGDWQCSECDQPEVNRRPSKITSNLTREISGPKDSNANMHKALFVPGGLPDGSEVGYYVKGQKFLTGIKMGLGIACSCCEQVISCSQFEQHAGWGSRRNPYSSIYLADGRSLHIAALALGQNKGDETPVENVDYCTECGDGGELVLCDSCPAAYHPECAGLVSIPAGNWFCPPCKRQRFTVSGRKVTNKSRIKSKLGGGAAIGKEDTDDRYTVLLKATDIVSSGCVFCRSGEFEKVGFGPRTILLCDQCEREYHVGCLKEQGLANLKALPEGEWFCDMDCGLIHSILNMLVANGMELLEDSIISKAIRNKEGQASTDGASEPTKVSFAWQLLHGRRGDPLNGKTLNQAAAIFSESFDPIVDESSGRDLIPVMVHSRNIRDQDFGGMHCVVLKRNDEVVTAALVRIFGRQFAELPLVATKSGSTGQGFCKALILSIERLLGILNVQRLILPAAEGAEGIWVNKFAFSPLSDEESRKYRSEVQMMIFKGSSLLQKSILPLKIY